VINYQIKCARTIIK